MRAGSRHRGGAARQVGDGEGEGDIGGDGSADPPPQKGSAPSNDVPSEDRTNYTWRDGDKTRTAWTETPEQPTSQARAADDQTAGASGAEGSADSKGQSATLESVTEGFHGQGVSKIWAAVNGYFAEDISKPERHANHYAVTAVCAVNYADKRSSYFEVGPVPSGA